MKKASVVILLLLPIAFAFGQHDHASHAPTSSKVDSQPLLAQALRLKDALAFLGSAMSKADEQKLKALEHQKPGQEVSSAIQEILDPYCLAVVSINPESRVKLDRGQASAKLIQNGWATFL
ncbi:hypothetical protein WBG78_03650 [Chryseolinea sp. T2]|uniref:hypothetical protein n=1 Tax=Chryseolinea sp. T2 TaxID=3129255 RepID=UPI0030776B98